jgi:glycosyltransferase involved in cell wall biosynthesis
MKLSAVIITHNEAQNIARCLAALAWADEVILVDSCSTDDTVAVARSFPNVKIFEQAWQGFGPQRNFAISKASNDWLLVVDADEEIMPLLRDEIALTLAASGADAYRIPRRMFFCGHPLRFGGTYPDYQLRLFKKGVASYDNSPLHERLNATGKICDLANPLNHYSYRDLTDYFERFNRYSTLDAQRRFARGERFSMFRLPLVSLNIFWRLVVRGGIFDGYHGIVWGIFCSWYDFVKFAKIREMEVQYESKR